MAHYTTLAGEVRTTCGGHRTVGFAFIAGGMACRQCHEAAGLHESIAETLERRNATAAA